MNLTLIWVDVAYVWVKSPYISTVTSDIIAIAQNRQKYHKNHMNGKAFAAARPPLRPGAFID